jgi:hypothetical protein
VWVFSLHSFLPIDAPSLQDNPFVDLEATVGDSESEESEIGEDEGLFPLLSPTWLN